MHLAHFQYETSIRSGERVIKRGEAAKIGERSEPSRGPIPLLRLPLVLLEILGGGVLPGSSNPDPISDQTMYFSAPVFRLDF